MHVVENWVSSGRRDPCPDVKLRGPDPRFGNKADEILVTKNTLEIWEYFGLAPYQG